MHTFGKAVIALAAVGLVATTAACSSSGSSSDPATTNPAVTSPVTEPSTSTSTSTAPKPIADLPSLTGQSTSVKLDAGFASALQSLKVTPGLIGTAKLDANTGTLTFPITGGNVKVYNKGEVTPYVQGSIEHNGSGFTLTAGGKKVGLENFVIDPGNNSKLTGDVTLNGKSVVKGAKLFDLNGNTLQPITVKGTVATLTGTQVLLSSDAAGLLNKTFGITALKGGLLIGIATLLVNVG